MSTTEVLCKKLKLLAIATALARVAAAGDSTYFTKLLQPTFGLIDIVGPFLDQAVALLQHVPVWFQPRVDLEDTWGALVEVAAGALSGAELPVPSAGVAAAADIAIVEEEKKRKRKRGEVAETPLPSSLSRVRCQSDWPQQMRLRVEMRRARAPATFWICPLSNFSSTICLLLFFLELATAVISCVTGLSCCLLSLL